MHRSRESDQEQGWREREKDGASWEGSEGGEREGSGRGQAAGHPGPG